MYAEIPHDVVDDFNAQVEEGQIYVITVSGLPMPKTFSELLKAAI